ncbi:MAG: gliding motility-associated ABC transporter ATP-binding subunit GldA [Salibacteraceae bacterium]|jgi:ABC-2 type transport system ATP-binding protein|nr:gliding motility-associated ABC transporter ATP-binding subunit GldA [Salibacteraceae bacterium]MDP4685696.1 gliding motility-associated ABC transporter ATP-binding subunit GldA [Salibacteraceae bacterium]MDP4762374.1 gliding motility-associated ABC transporter ATP-binding subunit GldA [Salibacteraceae bacterium]MDP4843371.1 gliding motility-associated ABC transporter ATP-binding subunit GldA [Salibacteraceae bacterium]MDP4964026.1 gliding motility-associated ABC transporter ATP-binding subu
MSIEVKNVTKIYGEQRALNEVSFSINSGNIVGFLGPNGAGKSTMMKIITCYLPQSEGSVKVCGFDVVDQPIEVKKRVGYLPEHNPLYPEMYVREYLEFIAGIHKIPNKQKRIDEMIDLVGLTIERKKKIGTLSKGYRQRVGLAQAMIHDPEVLILDEPTTGLDPNQIVEIRNLIKSIGENRTVMLSTHLMQEVEAICDQVMIINRGNIVANDKAENLRAFQNQQMIRVEFDKSVAPNMLKTIAGVTDVERVNDKTWLLGSASDKDVRQAVFAFAVEKELSVLTIQKEEKRMEDIFKKLTS